MKLTRSHINILSAVSLLTLAACGGGGDDGVSTFNADASQVAGSGVKTVVVTDRTAGADFLAVSQYLQDLEVAEVGGTRTVALACKSGSGSVGYVKAAASSGLATGDQATFVFHQCATAQGLFDGTLKVIAQSSLGVKTGGLSAQSYRAELTGFATAAARYDGAADVAYDVSVAGDSRFAVPAGRSLKIQPASGVVTALTLSGGAAFKGSAKPAADGDASAQDLSRDFSGSVMLASGGALQTLSVSTPNTLVEKTSASGVVTPVRGVVNTASAERKVATSATLNGATLTIGADINGDGLWDAVFDVSWASLGL